jgi:hypothetical protein
MLKLGHYLAFKQEIQKLIFVEKPENLFFRGLKKLKNQKYSKTMVFDTF